MLNYLSISLVWQQCNIYFSSKNLNTNSKKPILVYRVSHKVPLFVWERTITAQFVLQIFSPQLEVGIHNPKSVVRLPIVNS